MVKTTTTSKTFGSYIRELRIDNDIGQRELAKKIGVAPSYLNDMEKGRIQQMLARSKKLKIGQSLPEVEALLGPPHERINGSDGSQADTQLWIYFTNQKSLQLSFYNFRLFKIEKI